MDRYDLFEITEDSGDTPIMMECEKDRIMKVLNSCVSEDIQHGKSSHYYVLESSKDFDAVLIEVTIFAKPIDARRDAHVDKGRA